MIPFLFLENIGKKKGTQLIGKLTCLVCSELFLLLLCELGVDPGWQSWLLEVATKQKTHTKHKLISKNNRKRSKNLRFSFAPWVPSWDYRKQHAWLVGVSKRRNNTVGTKKTQTISDWVFFVTTAPRHATAHCKVTRTHKTKGKTKERQARTNNITFVQELHEIFERYKKSLFQL